MTKRASHTHWRWLLPLLWGLGVWYVIDWWLSPRAFLELKYRVQDALQHAQANGLDLASDRDNYLQDVFSWRARIWDRSNRYLLTEESCNGSLLRIEVYDLVTGKRVVSHQHAPKELDWASDNDIQHLAGPDGIIYAIKHCHGHPEPSPSDPNTHKKPDRPKGAMGMLRFDLGRAPFLRDELYEWNIFTNEARLVKKYPVGRVHSISQDGSTVLETQRITPLMPSLLLPASLPNLLAAQAQSTLGSNDLAIMRVYQLPEQPCRCTLTVRWLERENAALSSDGAFLVLPLAGALKGFTRFTTESVITDGQATVPDRLLAANPLLRLRIYDLRDRQLQAEKAETTPYYSLGTTDEPQIFKFEANKPHRASYDSDILFQLLSAHGRSGAFPTTVERLDAQQLHYGQLTREGSVAAYELVTVHADGTCHYLPQEFVPPSCFLMPPKAWRRSIEGPGRYCLRGCQPGCKRTTTSPPG